MAKKIMINVQEAQKEQWVKAAHQEMVSLSEWIRRACDQRLGVTLETVAANTLTDQQIQEAAEGAMLLAEQAALTAGATTAEDAGATDGTPPDAKGGGTTVAPAAEQSRPSPAATVAAQTAVAAVQQVGASAATLGKRFTPDFKAEPKPKKPRR